MNDTMVALLGVPIIFALAFLWCWVEERSKARSKRKYDQQMAKYDTWTKASDRM